MKKFLSVLGLFVLFGCAVSESVEEPVATDEVAIDNDANAEVAKLMELYAQAMVGGNDNVVADFETYLAEFDAKYDSELGADFRTYRDSRLSGGSGSVNHSGIPFTTDGAIYLSGGVSDAISAVISWVAPMVTKGKYYHGAALDLNKFDPSNMECLCLESAILKGAGYETPYSWKYEKPNVSVFNLKTPVNTASLNSAQAALAYYCDPNNTSMKYGFFKDYANIFSIVTKEDNYYWYCTKVIWRIYNLCGVNLDSDTSLIDWTTSGLYSVVKTYYYARYFYNWSTAKSKINSYISNAKKTIVLAEEIYYSPYVTKVYEDITAN